MKQKKYTLLSILIFIEQILPFQPVNVSDGQALRQRNDEEWDAAGKVIEQREDVVARAVGESHRQHQADTAHNT